MWPIGGEDKSKTGSGSESLTFLAKGVDFRGVIHFEGTIRVDGRLEGEVHTNGTLIVGEQGVIKGLISAGTVMTSGKINGTVTALEKVQINKPGILIGDVRTAAIAIEDGAHFHGMCDMGAHKWVEDQPSSPAAKNPHDLHDLTAHRVRTRSAGH
ncbi:MAG: polymer-forming cytoskeletal protein [Nitrospira sp.]|nr:polymer-forming cytoskeletal protein [Nitrospira sp.]MCP9461046.1 polymer-forming cytoskeletal protein [Nitrospira sp.]MCP9474047.1 polymer-forming cytoskeletal protein [Nitrospira sp.]